MIPTHFVDRMSKTLSGWLEGEGMSESLVEEAQERHRISHPEQQWCAHDLEPWPCVTKRLADRVEADHDVLEAVVEYLEAGEIGQALDEVRQALSPPMDK